ncbi:MAG: M6 family metalloprotease domain-containing protein [Paludibacteraceae bacterium]|nr:M6 family metalloprotease domain-containing protein [Paludibacteraceae bacterium]
MSFKNTRYILSVAALMVSLAITAVPARPGYHSCQLSDGSTIRLALMGDEAYHFWQTEDGRIAVEQPDGTFVVTDEAAPDAQTQTARRRAGRRYVNRAKKIGAEMMPQRVLFILVNFSDKSFSSASANYYKSSLGDETEGAKSMYNYFKLQSGGKYVPPIDVLGPVTLSNGYAYYGSNDSQGNDKHPAEMVVEACKALDNDVDFSQYDTNSDGFVDNVYVIYAGRGEADGGSSETIWPHQWDVYSSERFQVQLDGVYIRSYACSNELNWAGNYSMGTPLHEYSHVIGLPDYYDTQYGTNSQESRTPGSWSLMDSGSYNDDGKTPPNYSIYDKYYLGWLTPELLAKDDFLNVSLTTEYDDGYQITGGNELLPATTAQTVYYIENRQRTGWDAALPGHGMLVWQVTYDRDSWESNVLNNTAGSPRVTILSSTGNKKNLGTSKDPYPGVNTVRECTPLPGCAMTEISESKDVVSFKYNGGIEKPVCSYELVGEHCTVPADGSIAAHSVLSLTIVPDAGYSLDNPACWTVEMGLNNELQYGEDYTYNPETNEFRIEKVRDDITILAEAKKLFPLTWMAYGEVYEQTSSCGTIVMPASTPRACVDGKVFVGWCRTKDYASQSQAPEFVQAGDDVAGAEVYYAVFATQEGGEQTDDQYIFTDKDWSDATESWIGHKSGLKYVENQGVQVTAAASYTRAGAKSKREYTGVSKVTFNYCTNAAKGDGNITVAVGESMQTLDINSDGGVFLRNRDFAFDRASGFVTFVVDCKTNSIYVNAITITSVSPEEFRDYTTACSGPAAAVENTRVQQPRVVKAIRDGKVVIIRDNEVYNILGVKQ